MTYKMYLMSIAGLEEECLQQDAMCLLDSYRKELVYKYKKEKDRLRAIAAGLLLQAGFLELDPIEGDARSFIAYLKAQAEQRPDIFPIELLYQKGKYGKPYWDRSTLEAELAKSVYSPQKLWHFNLSHSGEYVVLVVADTEVGVDIQEERDVKHYPGGYKAFSRMEAYVKCTGEGFSRQYKTYEKYAGKVPGYDFLDLELVEGYATWLCFKRD